MQIYLPIAEVSVNAFLLLGLGGLVGILSGMFGVGGGFLIVPALVLLGGLAMQQAVATSLVIIALKSIAGFAKYLEVIEASNLSIDWGVIGFFAVAGILGSLVGSHFACKISQEKLLLHFFTRSL